MSGLVPSISSLCGGFGPVMQQTYPLHAKPQHRLPEGAAQRAHPVPLTIMETGCSVTSAGSSYHRPNLFCASVASINHSQKIYQKRRQTCGPPAMEAEREPLPRCRSLLGREQTWP